MRSEKFSKIYLLGPMRYPSGKGTCSKPYNLSFHLQDTLGGRRKPTYTSFLLTHVHMHARTIKKKKNLFVKGFVVAGHGGICL